MFLNSTGTADDCDKDIAAFLRYVNGKAAEGKFLRAVDQTVQKVKGHPETRREYMTLEMELRRTKQAGYDEGMARGIEKMVLGMLRKRLDITLIADVTSLPVETIRKIARCNRLL